jgi:hypothetical protein
MYLDWFFIKDFQPWEITAVIVTGLFIGMGKTGINGIPAIMIPFLVMVFGPKESTGILLPMLCFADLLAVIWYRRNAEWKHIFRLLPWALGGLALAIFVERFISAREFRILIGACVFGGLGIMVWNDLKGKNSNVPSKWWFSALCGLAGGFSTMIGNAAAPIMAVFLLSMRLPKQSYIGTGAWFFMIVNYIKIPLHIFAWDNISLRGFMFNLTIFPIIIVGAVIGILLVRRVSEKVFRTLIYVLTTISASLLFLTFS